MTFWLDGFIAWMAEKPETGACAVAFPSYRPYLGEAIATRLNGAFLDFRLRYMQPLGWQAAKLPLSDITDAAEGTLAEHGTLVLQNSEALLSVSDAETRRTWFGEVIARGWRGRLILPLMLYPADWPEPDLLYTVAPEDLPDESLLERLSNFQ